MNEVGLLNVWNDNKLLVSETALRFLLSPQSKKFTLRYKQMCGCETCIIIKQFQLTLNSWRKRKIKLTNSQLSNEYSFIVIPQDKKLHYRSDDAMKEIMHPLA